MKTVIRIEPNKDFLRVLTALGVEWDLALSGNGDGNWALIELDEESDQRLLDVWDRLTELRLAYLDHAQRAWGIQLVLPLEGSCGDG